MTELLLVAVAQAEGAAGTGGQAPPGGGMFGGFVVPMVLMILVFYFLLIRPQQKQQKELSAFRKELQRGDKVVSSGGIYGTVVGITDDVVTLEVAKDVRIRILRTQIAGAQKQAQEGSSSADEPKAKTKQAKAR